MLYKKIIFVGVGLMLLAAGCNRAVTTPNAIDSNANSNTNNAESQTPPDENTNSNATVGESNQQTPSANSTIFTNPQYKVSLDYTGLSMVTKAPSSYIPTQNNFGQYGNDLLSLYLNPSVYKGTNLESGWVNLAVNNKLDIKGCYAKLANAERLSAFTQKRLVQGNTWYYPLPNPIGGAAAGHQGETETYRMYKNNSCYEVVLGLSKFTRENLENPDSVKEVDIPKIFNYLGAVFNKLQVK